MPDFYSPYTGASVRWSEACRLVSERKGDIFCAVVKEASRGGDKKSLTYGFFYRGNDGQLADVLMNTRPWLLSCQYMHIAVTRLKEAYPEAYAFILPPLDEADLVKRGDPLTQITPKVANRFDVVSPPEVY